MTKTPPKSAQEHYRHAVELNKSGKLEEARVSLSLAAREGHLEAAYSLAACMAEGIGGPMDRATCMDLLQLASSASPAARQLLALGRAVGWKTQADWTGAVRGRVADADKGDPHAMVEVGLLLLLQDPMNAEADRWIEAAARINDIAGITASLRRGIELGFSPPQATARQMVLLTNNHPQAQYFDYTMSRMNLNPAPESLTHTPNAADASARLEQMPYFHGELALFSQTPYAVTAQKVLPRAVADYVLNRYAPRMRPAAIFDPASGTLQPHPHRRSFSASLTLGHQDLVIHAVERRLAAFAGLDWTHTERMVVLGYRQGDEYRPHYDYIEAGDGGAADQEIARAGQRVATVLVTLGEDFEGGATAFPHVNKVWRGAQGDAITWRNVTQDGRPDPASLHAGEPVTSGVKALASLWLRERPYGG